MTRLEIAVRLIAEWTQPGTLDAMPEFRELTSVAFHCAEAILEEETRRQTEDALEQAEAAAAHAPLPPMATRFSLDGVPLDAPSPDQVPLMPNARRCRACGLDWWGEAPSLPKLCTQCGGPLIKKGTP